MRLISENEKKAAAAAHLIPLLGMVFPGGHLVGPLILFLVSRRRSSFVRNHAAESFNFQLTVSLGMLILWTVGIVLVLVKLGFIIEWMVTWMRAPAAFNWPGWPVLGGWALAALAGVLVSGVLVLVLWIWNFMEIVSSFFNALKGEASRYSFIWRVLRVNWKDLPLDSGGPL